MPRKKYVIELTELEFQMVLAALELAVDDPYSGNKSPEYQTLADDLKTLKEG